MSGSNEQQPQPPPDLNAAIQALIQQQLRLASGQGQQVQLPSAQPPPSQYSNDPSQGPDLLERIGLRLGGGALPGAPAQLQAQMGRQALLNFGIGLMSSGRFATPGEVLAGGLRGAQGGLLGSEAAQAGQQEYALNAQAKLAELGLAQQKNRTEALQAIVPLLQMQGRLGLPPLFGGSGPGGGGQGGGPGTGGGDIYGLPKDQFLPAIAQRESGGDPTALNYVAKADPSAIARGATASGKYQMVDSTWLTAAKAAGIDVTKYPTAASAPEAVQDQVASKLYDMQGTAPWDPSKWTKNWVQGSDGKYTLQTAPYAGPPGASKGTPPTQGAGAAVGPYKVAGPVVAPPGPAAATSGLPVPPVPPAGAVPTVSTPEEASATAKAAGTPVQVPGVAGLWAKPEGGVTGTPGLIVPGTATAAVTPPAPTPPPTGPVTPPVAAQPPAAQPQPPAATPPAAPARDIMARSSDGTFVVPNDQLSLLEYQQRGRHVPSPEEMQQRGMVLPENPTALQTAYAGVQQAERDANAARQVAQTTYVQGGDSAKALEAVNNADKQAQDARNSYTTLIQGAGEKNAQALQNYYKDQDAALAADYKNQVVDPRNTAKQQQQASDLKIHEGLVAAGTADDQKVLQGIDATTESAHDTLSALDVARKLSIAAGNKSALAVVAPGVATMLQRSGLLSQDDSNKLDAQTALDGVLSKVAGSMRAGMGFSRMTNADLQFLQNIVGTSNIPESRRNAMFAFMQTALERQYQYGGMVRELYGGGPNAGGMSLAKAREAADDKLGHIVQTVPDGLPADQGDLFVQQHVSPGTFYVRDGQLRIRGQ